MEKGIPRKWTQEAISVVVPQEAGTDGSQDPDKPLLGIQSEDSTSYSRGTVGDHPRSLLLYL